MKSRFFRRSLGVLLLAATLFAASGSGPANAEPVSSGDRSVTLTAAAAAAPATCTDPVFGGTFYCGYGTWEVSLPDSTWQIFVVDVNYRVYTRWYRGGSFSNWTSLGGSVNRTVSTANFLMCGDSAGNIWIDVKGTNGTRYYKKRTLSTGQWSPNWINASIC